MINSLANPFGADAGSTPATTSDLGQWSPTAPFYGRLDRLEGTRLRGWVLSIHDFGATVPLLVSVGGVEAQIVPDREGDAFSALLGRRVRCRFEADLAALFPGIDLAGTAVSVRIAATGHQLENTPQVVPGPRSVKANVDRVEGRRIIGWAINTQDETEMVEVEVLMDGRPAGLVAANLQRRDLLPTFATCDHGFEAPLRGQGGTLHLRDRRSGAIVFGPLAVEPAVTPDGHPEDGGGALASRLDAIAGLLEEVRAELPRHRRLASYPLSDYAAYFRDHYAETAGRRAALAARAAAFPDGPSFSVLMVVCDPPLRFLAEAIASVNAQLYGRWELCIVDDASRDDGVRELLRREAARDDRIRIAFLPERQGPCSAANRALEMARGSHAAFLGQSDRFAFDGLFRMAEALREASVPVLYSDEDRIAPDGGHADPILKPGFDPELLRSIDYVGHLLVVERPLLERIGGLRPGFEGAHGHDLLLRLYERTGSFGIRHVPRILYHRRAGEAFVSDEGVRHAEALERTGACVREHLARTGTAATVSADLETVRRAGGILCARVRYRVPAPAPKVSIVVPTKDAAGLVDNCVSSLLAKTDYPDFEIVLVDHESVEPGSRLCFERLAGDPRVRVAAFHGPFNWAAINNAAVRECRGEVLCFLNNDVQVADGDWLQDMVSRLSRPGVGAVGAKLLYPNGTVQHAGVVVGVGGVAEHAFVGLATGLPGYLGQAALPRTVSAVTGACLATTRTVFHAVGGFEMANLPVAYADVDYCLKLRQAGLQVVWSPHALLYHLETQTRGADDTPEKAARLAREADWLRGRWKRQLDDPFYNPHFEPSGPVYGLLRPPV